jgi:hypothetical protein
VLVVQERNASHPMRKFVNDVIYRMNQQNPMKASNLRANDDQQVALSASFAPYKMFCERREANGQPDNAFYIIRDSEGYARAISPKFLLHAYAS